jgi:hypothetical protein
MTQEWSDGVHQRIARAIRAARGERSAQEIANETERLGHKVSRDSITNIENGRKSTLDVCEWLILASALGVPAVGLLLPNLPDGDVELLPGQPVSAERALYQVTGEIDDKPRSALGKLLKLTRERLAKEEERVMADAGIDLLVKTAGKTGRDEDEIAAVKQIFAVVDIAGQIDELNGQMAEIRDAMVAKREEQE